MDAYISGLRVGVRDPVRLRGSQNSLEHGSLIASACGWTGHIHRSMESHSGGTVNGCVWDYVIPLPLFTDAVMRA